MKCGIFFLSVTCSLLACVPAAAQAIKYPRVNLAATYEVDPVWPKRSPGARWGEVPGIAVDAKDNVYVFTRAKPPVQVYDAKGTFLRGWGDAIGSAHHNRVYPHSAVSSVAIARH